MENKHAQLALVLMPVVLLVVLIFGSVAPGLAIQIAEHQPGLVWDGLHGLWADPVAGGGSDGG